MAGTGSADQRAARAARMRGLRRDKANGSDWSTSEWGDVMAKISHDIRTPLNAVIGFADLMHRELHGQLGSDRYREYVGHIRDSGADLLRAAEETLLLALLVGEPTAITRVDTSLAGIVGDAVGQLGGELATASADVEMLVPGDIVVRVDPGATRLALKHLLRCAVMAAPRHAVLQVGAGVEHGVTRLQIDTAAPATDYAPSSPYATSPAGDAGIPLARSILRLQGADLLASRGGLMPNFVVLLEGASQPDFFSDY